MVTLSSIYFNFNLRKGKRREYKNDYTQAVFTLY